MKFNNNNPVVFIQVTAFAGRNRIGLITSYEGDMQVENIQIRYNVFSLSNIRDHPSICEVYFTVESKVRLNDEVHVLLLRIFVLVLQRTVLVCAAAVCPISTLS